MARRRDPVTGRLLVEGVHPRVSPATGNVTYRARLSWGPRDRRRHASQTFATPEAAEDWIMQLRADIRHGRHVDASALTVADYHAQWVARMRGGWSGSRMSTVNGAWEGYIAEAIGGIVLQRLTRHDVQRLIDTMTRAGLKPSTVRLYLAGVTSMLNAAVEDGILHRSPAQRLAMPRQDDDERVTWSPLQMRRFLHATKDDTTYGPLWALLIATGCRIGEALALEWDAVNFDERIVAIRARLSRDERGAHVVKRGTKTTRRGRVVPIEPWMIDRLREHQERAPRSNRYVFCDGHDRLPYERVLYRWHQVVAEVGLPMMRIHDIRHSVATAMIAAGISERIVQEVLGHKSVMTTLDRYAHVAVRTQRQGTSALSDMLGYGESDTTTSAETGGSADIVRQFQAE